MPPEDKPCLDRRRFVATALPACAATCLFLRDAPLAAAPQPPDQKPKHKFDAEVPQKLTFRQGLALQYTRSFIPLALFLRKKLGREQTIALLEASADEQAPGQAAPAVKAMGANDFAAFKRVMSDPHLANLWTYEVVEDSESVYELRVTECLWASIFRDANAGDEGHAAVCHGDFAFAKAFSPNLQLVRNKTLMQGHPICNHRYLWKK